MMNVACLYKNDLTVEFREKLARLYIDSKEFEHPLGKKILFMRFAAWWDANPNLDDTIPVAWIITDENSSLYGVLSQIPLTFEYKNKKYAASVACAYYAKPEARGPLSASIFLAFDRQTGKLLTYTNTPRQITKSIITRLKYQNIAPNVSSYTHILSIDKYIKNWILHHLPKKYLVIKKSHLQKNRFKWNTDYTVINENNDRTTTNHKYTIKICDNISKFMQYYRIHPINNQYIGISRDEKTLNWLLFSPEVKNLLSRKVILIFKKNGDYCGYCVFDIKFGAYYPFARITELNLLSPDKSHIKEIIRYIKKQSIKKGCFILTYRQLVPNQNMETICKKQFHMSNKLDGDYFVKVRKEILPCKDPYSIIIPSDLDPDYGLF